MLGYLNAIWWNEYHQLVNTNFDGAPECLHCKISIIRKYKLKASSSLDMLLIWVMKGGLIECENGNYKEKKI